LNTTRENPCPIDFAAGEFVPEKPKKRPSFETSLVKGRAIIIAVVLFVVGFASSYQISFLQHKADISRLRDQVTLEIEDIRNNLSRELYANINLTRGLMDLVRIQGAVRKSQFDAMARELTSHGPLIRNVALAPENVIRFIYPLKGNEKALGLSYLEVPDQAAAVLRVMTERYTVVAGPLRLVQGGVGIIGRTPIFIKDSLSDGKNERYWGMASTVIDFDSLIFATGICASAENLRIALRGTDGTGSRGKVFWGDTNIFNSGPVTMDITLPSGAWQMAAVPSKGWPHFNPLASVEFYLGVVLSVFLSTLFFRMERISQGRAEALTALNHARDELEERVEQRTKELGIAKEAAESSDRLKSAFLATMSHELRTPLNSIIGFTGIILQGLVGEVNPEQKKQLTMVRDSAHHLLALINDVLDISKIEACQLELSREVYPIRQSIDKSIQVVAPLAQRKSLSISSDVDPEPLLIDGDRRRVEQVLINLLTNSVKFTSVGGITVSVIRSTMPFPSDGAERQAASGRSWVRVSVSDSGIGITPEDMGKLFQPFRQIDMGTTRRYEGTGLGLSICRRLVSMLGGEIRAQSDGPGRGSTFTFSLPEGTPRNGQNTDHRG
jgi:signal transduction histidine kinase